MQPVYWKYIITLLGLFNVNLYTAMVKVIINADDLGLNPTVNAKIYEALSKGYVTSSTILANSEYWDEVRLIISKCQWASFGVHLNLTEGKALTENLLFKSLGIVGDNNCFSGNIRHNNLSDPKLQEAIYDEWDAQLNKIICQENVNVTHVDGHHHIHTDFALQNILVSLLNKYGITRVRNRYTYPVGGGKRLIRNVTNKIASRNLYRMLKPSSLKIVNRPATILNYHVETSLWHKHIENNRVLTDYFDSYEHFLMQISMGYKPKDGEIAELMCHPGHENYKNEFQMIKLRKLQQHVSDLILISYNDL